MMAAQQETAPTDNRALLYSVGHRLVRAVAAESTRYSEALYAVVGQRQRDWKPEEWEAALGELDTSTLTISQFLEAEHAKACK